MKWTLIFLLGGGLAETTMGWTYHYSDKEMPWKEAREWCQKSYTDMVVIQNQEENDYLVSKILQKKESGPYYWIGITRNSKNDTWTWVGNNSTWTGNNSWASGEPNNDYATEFCVEIYTNSGDNRGKWNDEKCSHAKFAVCYRAQCNATSCVRGRCQEGIKNTTCLCEPGFYGDRCQTAVQCPSLTQPDNGYYRCEGGNWTFNSTCQLKCNLGFSPTHPDAVTCGVGGVWSGPRPVCTSYKKALLAVTGCGALLAFCCICFCWMKRRKRKKVTQVRNPEEGTHPSTESQG